MHIGKTAPTSYLQDHTNKSLTVSFRSQRPHHQPMTNSVKITKANNGKFNLSEAIKNFIKGFLSPVSLLANMFKSVNGFATGALVIGGTIGAIAFGGTPVVIGAAIALGVLFTSLAGYKLVFGKNGDSREKAFKNLGRAGVSLIPLLFVNNKTSKQGQGLMIARFSNKNSVASLDGRQTVSEKNHGGGGNSGGEAKNSASKA